MAKFKKFLKEKFYNEGIPYPEDKNESYPSPQVKYDLVLFAGDYDPITRGEYQRVVEFVKEYIPANKHLFSEKLEIGLLCNDTDTIEESHIKENKYDLSRK
jgi:hypothetical protein